MLKFRFADAVHPAGFPRIEQYASAACSVSCMTSDEKICKDLAESSGSRFGAFIEVTHDGLAVVDRMGMIRYASPATEQMLGCEPGALIDDHISKHVHPDDVAYIMERLALEVPKDIGKPIAYRARHRDGRWRCFEAVVPRIDRGNISDHFIFFIRDITMHQRIEQQTRLTERIVICGTWRVDIDNPYPYLSPGMICLFGYDPNNSVPESKYWPLRMVHHSDVSSVLKILRGLISSPRPFSFTCRICRNDGAERIIKTAGYVETDSVDKGVGIIGVSRDITEMCDAENKLAESERKYRLLTEQSSDIIAQLSPTGTIEFISNAVQRHLGKDPDSFIGQSFHSLLEKDDRESFRNFLAQIRQGREDTLATVRLGCKDNQTRWLELTGRAVMSCNDGLDAIVCTARDITERKMIQLKLMEARQQAEEISASKSEFIRHVSHEFRTPLNAIMGFSELIRDQIFGEIGDQHYTEYASIIYESGSMLNVLINNLLDLSKVEAGRYELHMESLVLKEIVPICIQQVLPEAMKKELSIEDDMSNADFDLQADKAALMQILINLLSNAVKFTPERGRIDLKAHAEGGSLWLQVSDTGIGIHEEDIERVVGVFEQVLDRTDAIRIGSGIGLALAKSLTELHGGELHIESEPGVGTTVSVVLPLGGIQKAVA